MKPLKEKIAACMRERGAAYFIAAQIVSLKVHIKVFDGLFRNPWFPASDVETFVSDIFNEKILY